MNPCSFFLRGRTFVAAAFTLAALASSAHATNLVLNGGFESLLVPGVSSEIGSRFPAQQVIGWTTSGYNFVFTPGAADSTYANSEYGATDVGFWGPASGSANGLPASSPAGGNYVAQDGAFTVAPIQQTINGLIVGARYNVSFWWGGAQQLGFNGVNTEQFVVSLGGQSISTAVLTNADHGFTGWQYENFTFTADNTSDVLSFLAVGTPDGVPPFSVLDGVSLVSAVPEPSSVALLLTGFAGVGGVVRRRLKKTA